MSGSKSRERLIASLSWWAGWCVDHEDQLPDLTRLGGVLMDAKHRLALDRNPESRRSEETGA